MLKKCISETCNLREGKPIACPERPTNTINTHIPNNNFNQNSLKIAAPKPVRARPLGLTHMAYSKWIETSPIKNENSDNAESKFTSDLRKDQQNDESFFQSKEMPKLDFQIEYNLSQKVGQLKNIRKRKNSPMSELKSLMEAEQELNDIFSRSKVRQAELGSTYNHYFQWSFEKNCNLNNKNNSNEETNSSSSIQSCRTSVGFSKFGHFKPPIKRPKCNPIIKDERFRRLNNIVNEGNQSDSYCGQRIIPCDSQVAINPNFCDTGSYCLQNFENESNFMFAFQQTSLPTAYSSGMNPFSFIDYSAMNSTADNFSWLNGSIYHHHNSNDFQMNEMNDKISQQMQVQQSQSHFNIQNQFNNMNLSNSLPEYDTFQKQFKPEQQIQSQQQQQHYQSLFQVPQLQPTCNEQKTTQTQ